MAGARAALRRRKTILLEKNREPGVKILLAGGGRCNLTHATDARGVVAAFGPTGRFLHSALAALGPPQIIELFEAEEVPTKVEPGGKVFPLSDRASDVRAALLPPAATKRLYAGRGRTTSRSCSGGRRLSTDHAATLHPGGKGGAGYRRAIISGLRHDRRQLSLGSRARASHRHAARRVGSTDQPRALGARFAGHHPAGCSAGSGRW